MTLLDAHLEQLVLCSASLSELPFPPPRIFTNALLQPHDITTLIRDTEPHERALFTVPPPPPTPRAQDPATSGAPIVAAAAAAVAGSSANRRNTTFHVEGGRGGNGGGGGVTSASIEGGGANAMRAPRRNTAVGAVLGRELVEKIRKGGGGGAGSGLGYRQIEREGKEKGDVDVEVLLEGAEKLCNVYPIPGALEKIMMYRQRYQRLAASIEDYEVRVAEQADQLQKMNQPRDYGEVEVDKEDAPEHLPMTEEDWRREEEDIRELERKKQNLEERVTSMRRDISGVLR